MSKEGVAVKEAAANYSALTITPSASFEYKQTEVGVIPKDWEVERLDELADIDPDNLPSNTDPSYEFKYVSLEDINEGTLVGLSELKFRNAPSRARRKLRKGDILVSTVRPNLKSHFLFDCDESNWICSTGFSVVRCREGKSLPNFVFFHLFNGSVPRQIDALLTGSNYPAINGSDVRALEIPVPPTLEEQTAIAAALSDVDALLAALDKLIAKKRAIKTAAMQQLLTGKQRLPGFGEKWPRKRLGDFSSIRNSKVLPLDIDPDTPCVELEHIGQGDGRLLEISAARYSTSAKYRFFKGDVLFGRLRSYLRKFWHADRDGICTTEIWPLMVDPKQSVSGFLHAIVQTDQFIEAAGISYGTHMPRADWGVMRNFEVRLPQVDEQTAIATVLSDMDAEIAAIEARRDKTQAIKQGMMQELLAGRVRLVPAETGE